MHLYNDTKISIYLLCISKKFINKSGIPHLHEDAAPSTNHSLPDYMDELVELSHFA